MIRASLLVTGIGELATLAVGPTPRVGHAMRELGLLHHAAVAIDRGKFVFVGTERQAQREVRLRSGGSRWNAHGATVTPGFVDAHTHVIFAGDRSKEIEDKLEGRGYTEIARRGGGMFSTVRATRTASSERLLRQSATRVQRMLRSGSTTIEVKSGYALDHPGVLRLLSLIPSLARRTRARLVPTYLGAHAVPPEFAGRSDSYVEQMIRRTLPVIARRKLAGFCDVFCEPGFFSVRQSERLLRAASALGLGTKIHADEFVAGGGAALAARLPTRSAEHLLVTPSEDRDALARVGVTAVLLPVTPFASFTGTRSPGRAFVDAGVPVALGPISPRTRGSRACRRCFRTPCTALVSRRRRRSRRPP